MAGRFDPILTLELRPVTGAVLHRFLQWLERDTDIMDPVMIGLARESGIALTDEVVDDLISTFYGVIRGGQYQCAGYSGDPGASAPRCEGYIDHPGPHYIRPGVG